MAKLKSETNTSEVRDEIQELVEAKFGDDKDYDVYFEHGQWWVTVGDFSYEGSDQTYSVVTCAHGCGFGKTDLDFEAL